MRFNLLTFRMLAFLFAVVLLLVGQLVDGRQAMAASQEKSQVPVAEKADRAEQVEKTDKTEAIEKKEYDGLWFCGFNFHKDLFGGEHGKQVRQAFNYAINRGIVCQKIVGDEVIPAGVIPPSMKGHDPALKGYSYDLKKAKELMRKAGYTMKDRALKKLVLLHTDGEKTVKIAKQLAKDLQAIGVKLMPKQVSYADFGAWEKELSSGRFHLYLMGYKAEEPENTLSLVKPLFSEEGTANVGKFSNDRVDLLIFQAEKTSDTTLRTKKLVELDRLLLADPPTVNLFYITKLPDIPEDFSLEQE